MKSLLPTAPKYPVFEPLLADELTRVPEVMFEERLPRNLHPQKAQAHLARAIARIHHVNKSKTDGYMEGLLGERPDLRGLPFKMGDDCRSGPERTNASRSVVRLTNP